MTTYLAEFLDSETDEVVETYLVAAPNLLTAMELAEEEAQYQGFTSVTVRPATLIQI